MAPGRAERSHFLTNNAELLQVECEQMGHYKVDQHSYVEVGYYNNLGESGRVIFDVYVFEAHTGDLLQMVIVDTLNNTGGWRTFIANITTAVDDDVFIQLTAVVQGNASFGIDYFRISNRLIENHDNQEPKPAPEDTMCDYITFEEDLGNDIRRCPRSPVRFHKATFNDSVMPPRSEEFTHYLTNTPGVLNVECEQMGYYTVNASSVLEIGYFVGLNRSGRIVLDVYVYHASSSDLLQLWMVDANADSWNWISAKQSIDGEIFKEDTDVYIQISAVVQGSATFAIDYFSISNNRIIHQKCDRPEPPPMVRFPVCEFVTFDEYGDDDARKCPNSPIRFRQQSFENSTLTSRLGNFTRYLTNNPEVLNVECEQLGVYEIGETSFMEIGYYNDLGPSGRVIFEVAVLDATTKETQQLWVIDTVTATSTWRTVKKAFLQFESTEVFIQMTAVVQGTANFGIDYFFITNGDPNLPECSSMSIYLDSNIKHGTFAGPMEGVIQEDY